jgi:hypothetical protein
MQVVFDEIHGEVDPRPVAAPGGEPTHARPGADCKCLDPEKVRRAARRIAERDARLRAD